MTRLPLPVSETAIPEFPLSNTLSADRGFAAWQNERGELETGTLDDFVRARRDQVERSPADAGARTELGRAYLWSGDGEHALETLAPLHHARPSDRELQSMILDALALLGRSSSDFAWSEEPILVPLDRDLMDGVYDLLASDRRPATVLDLCLAVAEEGHPTFDADDLLIALRRDGRFLVHTSSLAPECAVVLAKLHCL